MKTVNRLFIDVNHEVDIWIDVDLDSLDYVNNMYPGGNRLLTDDEFAIFLTNLSTKNIIGIRQYVENILKFIESYYETN